MSTRRLAAGFSAALCMVLVAGCGGVEPVAVQGDEPPVTTAVVQVEPTATTTTAVAPVEEPAGESPGPWMVNSTGRVAVVIHDDAPIPVNVQSVETVEVDGRLYQRVVATGMPDYVHVVTVADGAFLRERPRPGNDFTSGEPTVVVGDVLQFGSDLGYRSTGCSRAAGTGYGFWPPAPPARPVWHGPSTCRWNPWRPRRRWSQAWVPSASG